MYGWSAESTVLNAGMMRSRLSKDLEGLKLRDVGQAERGLLNAQFFQLFSSASRACWR